MDKFEYPRTISLRISYYHIITFKQIEKQMENLAVRAQKELILLYKEDAVTPNGTIDWLNARGYCSSHHHIRCSKRVFSRKPHSHMVSEVTNCLWHRDFVPYVSLHKDILSWYGDFDLHGLFSLVSFH